MTVYDLMQDPVNTIFAVDCQINNDHLEVAALWVDPLIQASRLRLRNGDLQVTIELPPEALNQPHPQVWWKARIPIVPDDE